MVSNEMQSVQAQIIEDFKQCASWEDKYKLIIQYGKQLEPLAEHYKDEKYLIKGCQSQVWLHADFKDGKVIFIGDSDAMIVKGLLSILLKIYSNQQALDIMQFNPSFIKDLGLNVHLSQSRSNGLAAMIKQVKLYAMAFFSLEQQKDRE